MIIPACVSVWVMCRSSGGDHRLRPMTFCLKSVLRRLSGDDFTKPDTDNKHKDAFYSSSMELLQYSLG